MAGEAIRNHAAVDELRKRMENFPGQVRSPGGKADSRNRDHGVSAPVREPRIPRDDRRAGSVGERSLDDESIGRRGKGGEQRGRRFMGE